MIQFVQAGVNYLAKNDVKVKSLELRPSFVLFTKYISLPILRDYVYSRL